MAEEEREEAEKLKKRLFQKRKEEVRRLEAAGRKEDEICFTRAECECMAQPLCDKRSFDTVATRIPRREKNWVNLQREHFERNASSSIMFFKGMEGFKCLSPCTRHQKLCPALLSAYQCQVYMILPHGPLLIEHTCSLYK